MSNRPFRSVLYIPASKERALEKVKTLAVDAIIFDLEDAVAVDEKVNARAVLAHALSEGGFGKRFKIVRINALDTEWGLDDAKAVAQMDADAVLLPKVGSSSDVETLAQIIPETQIWAMIESPAGVLNAAEIAAHPRMGGFVLGTNDLAKDLNTRHTADRAALVTSLQIALLAARGEGIVAIDGVFNAFKDEDGLRVECEQGRDFGFDGKTLIHPAQVAVTNEVFAPSEAEIDLAQRQIAAFDAAEAAGEGVAVVDGKIVENLHIVTARSTLAKAEMIQELDT